ncbi:MAG: hypothetical protein KFF73_20190 [Cyclobacteriaceae bacterium]|nr:hypothetical protein [Cyclobacteriaceae bacterium]
MANIRLFEHSSIAGRQLFLAHPDRKRFLLVSGDFLNEYEFNDIASSARLCTSPDDPVQMCFLFENGRFDGKFKAFAYQENRNIISLPYYNDMTSSAILVSQDAAEEKNILNVRKLAGEKINSSVDRQLQNFPGLSRDGDVLFKFSIDAFEIGHFGNDLINLEIPLLFNASFPFREYKVTLNHYIDLFITQENILKAAVAGWHYLVEPGILAHGIEKKLLKYSPGFTGYIESEINNMLHEQNWQRWKDVYLLPGRTDRIDIDYEGEVSDDCTVVLVPM